MADWVYFGSAASGDRLDGLERPVADEHADGGVEHDVDEVPHARVVGVLLAEEDGQQEVQEVCQERRERLLGRVLRLAQVAYQSPHTPRPLRGFQHSLQHQYQERQRSQYHLHDYPEVSKQSTLSLVLQFHP